jgi:hypothetical protein
MRSMKAYYTVLAAGLITVAMGTVTAQNAQRAGSTRPKVVSKAHQPVGTPHKASSLAPRPTRRKVFGDPIQPPILHNAPPAPK